MPYRYAKIVLLLSVALFFTIVVLNNAIFDYPSNYGFVEHVLSMDTLFSGETMAWRAFRNPAPGHPYWIYQVFYGSIIAWEASAGVLCAAAAVKLWMVREAPAREFNRAKKLAVYGLTLSMLQWFVAFITIGAEWFMMWESKVWNGQDAAFRMFTILGIILLFVSMKDEEIETG